MGSEKMVKGAVVNGYLKFVKKKWGVVGLQEAAKYAGIDENPRDGEWVPATTATKVLEWIRDNKGMKYVEDAGRYASTDLGVFTYIVASFMSIEKFIRRAQETYRTLFNYGEFVIEPTDTGAAITIKDARYPEPSCNAWKGALEGIMQVTRTKGEVRMIDADSPEDCKYEMIWK